jgi:CCR4-NOT transcriptional regulation complex NOT5 subunit
MTTITQLPQASPVSGQELMEVVQAGSSLRININDLFSSGPGAVAAQNIITVQNEIATIQNNIIAINQSIASGGGGGVTALATESTDGLMSALDKIKLDNFTTGSAETTQTIITKLSGNVLDFGVL